MLPWCPYARKWLQDHAAAAAVVTIDWRAPPRSADHLNPEIERST